MSVDRRERFETLSSIYALHRAPLAELGAAARNQHDPSTAALKAELEAEWLDELAVAESSYDVDATDAVHAMRGLAARDRLPDLYRWLASDASPEDLRRFIALEGGPDAGFDDLVAAAQIGIDGEPKLEMARNYWDEMGSGNACDVHTTLYRQLATALGLDELAAEEQPVSGLERGLLPELLAVNRWLQPELIGALGMIELQAGPRSRLMVQALERCGAPQAALAFYRVHAEVDPRHGADWLTNVVEPLVAQTPDWAPRMVRGAIWRVAVNAAFFGDLSKRFEVGRTDPVAA